MDDLAYSMNLIANAASEALLRPALTREEWMRRYAARVMGRAGWEEHQAMHAAHVGAECFEEDERAAGNALTWEEPEDAADEEMSNWDDDGEG